MVSNGKLFFVFFFVFFASFFFAFPAQNLRPEIGHSFVLKIILRTRICDHFLGSDFGPATWHFFGRAGA